MLFMNLLPASIEMIIISLHTVSFLLLSALMLSLHMMALSTMDIASFSQERLLNTWKGPTFPLCPHAAIYKLKGGIAAQKATKAKSFADLTLHHGLPGTFDSSEWVKSASSGHSGQSLEYSLIPNHDSTVTKLGSIIKKQIRRGLQSADTTPDTVDFVSGDDREITPELGLNDDIDDLLFDTLEDLSSAPLSPCSSPDFFSSPLPSSPQHVLCRCGVESDGYREAVEQETIQCSNCSNYTHSSCITMRFTPKLPEPFICHECIIVSPSFENFELKLLGLRKQSLNCVHKRLL